MGEYTRRYLHTQRHEQKLFGETVIARGFASREQVDLCLHMQAELMAQSIHRNLGELLVEKGFMMEYQVKLLLEDQDRVIMYCTQCGERYNVIRPWKGGALCPVEGSTLREAGRDGRVGVAATLGETSSPIGMEVGGCRIMELIARGATASVYKAKHIGLNRYVAIKLLPSLSNHPNVVKRLLFEARSVAKLEHPNVVQVYDVGYQLGYFFMVMQLLTGHSLEESLARCGAMKEAAALEVVRHVARGLGAAHAKEIVHRDIKPANIVLTEDGFARLTDFGLAQDPDVPEDMKPGHIVGTPFYMSPEQWLGHRADERSDLYSLGVCLYVMVTGQKPFEGETLQELMHQHLKVTARSPKEHVKELSDGLCAVIRKSIAKAPGRRYARAQEMLDDVERVIRGDHPQALEEFGSHVRCGFCEASNPAGEKKCRVCGEELHRHEGPLEFVAREGEFKCPGCGELAEKGSKACRGCKKPFCVRCGRRLAEFKDHCVYCLAQLPGK